MTTLKSVFFLLFLTAGSLIYGQSEDYSKSPYFQLDGKKSEFGFPLLANTMEAHILGPIADVVVKQTYRNSGTNPIEAIYVFPASTRAAVYHMEMIIGDRTIIAEVQTKKEARKTYKKAKNDGRRTSLLEQHRPNVFQMNVANIMPGEEISVILKYTEYIIPEDQKYTFVYPSVVGPRYTGEKEEDWAHQTYVKPSNEDVFDFNFSVHIGSIIPIVKLKCDTHKTNMDQSKPGVVDIRFDKASGFGGDRDFILSYSLAGEKIEAGIRTFEKDGEHFFLCQMEAPQLSEDIKIVPREYIFIVDVSGSMRGFPLSVSKDLMRNLFSNLRSSDKFNVLFFAGNAFMLGERSFLATEENINYAMKVVNAKGGGGGTRMLSAIKKAMNIPKDPHFSRSFVIATDGHVTVEEEAFKYISDHLGHANFYAFGIGGSVNRFLIEGLAHVGNGIPFIVSDDSKATQQAKRLQKYIQYPVLSDISIEGNGVELYDIIPENIPDLMTGRPIYFFGKYKPQANGNLVVKGDIGNSQFEKNMLLPAPKGKNQSIAHLWAREKIRFLDDFNTLRTDNRKVEEITNLGLKYNLLTKYTSFIAVDEEVVNKSKKPDMVKQILSIPQGMDHLAIGFEMEVEDLIMEKEAVVFDITIDSSNKNLQKVAEILLESLFDSSVELPLLSDMEIEVRFNRFGLLLLNENHKFYALIDNLGNALKNLGFKLEDLNFIINIEVV